MALPTLSGTGRLTADPELRFATSGTPVARINLAFNARRKDETGQWVDGDLAFVRASAFHQLAENIAETLTRGMEVAVTGRVKLDEWQDKQTGEKRSALSMIIDTIGPNLKGATASVTKNSEQGTASAEPAGWSGGHSDNPPF